MSQYPERWTAVPPNGQVCDVTGLKHSKLYSLLDGEARLKVRVACLRETGKTRGKRLFHVGDMLRFLDEKANENQ